MSSYDCLMAHSLSTAILEFKLLVQMLLLLHCDWNTPYVRWVLQRGEITNYYEQLL